MRGHWISTTRKLNKHYQNGAGKSVPWTERLILWHEESGSTYKPEFSSYYGYVKDLSSPQGFFTDNTQLYYTIDTRTRTLNLQPKNKRYKLRWNIQKSQGTGDIGVIFAATGSPFCGLPDLYPNSRQPIYGTDLQGYFMQPFLKDIQFAHDVNSGNTLTDLQQSGRSNLVLLDVDYSASIIQYPKYSSLSQVGASITERTGTQTATIYPQNTQQTALQKNIYILPPNSNNLGYDIILDFSFLADFERYDTYDSGRLIYPIPKNLYDSTLTGATTGIFSPLYFSMYGGYIGSERIRVYGDIWLEGV